MATVTHLRGVRVHLAGSIPDDADGPARERMSQFALQFARAVLRDGGTLIHGSHPTLIGAILQAAQEYADAGGARDAVTLVRTADGTRSAEELREIEMQRRVAAVEIIPSVAGRSTDLLVSMREWMAERCDVVVAVGGKWYGVNKLRAGVPAELEEALKLGKPGFVITAFGGATADYLKDDHSLLGRLRNGLSIDQNRALAASADVAQIISQMKLLPLVRGSITSGRLFRILSLDGGGLRGAFTAAVLAKWAEMLGPSGGAELIKHFDLVAGTSTGAILAIGLGLGLTPIQVLDFYRKQGPKIFPPGGKLRHWIKSKHDSHTLAEAMTDVFGEKKLADSCCRLVIPTVRADHGEAEVIVTPHADDRTGFSDYFAVEAALASSAAPTYFDEAIVEHKIAEQRYLDGGIWANNPVLPAIAEAVGQLGIPIDRIDILSVGTTGFEASFTSAMGGGKVDWGMALSNLFFAAQETASVKLVNDLLTRARHLRINQQTRDEIPLDNVAAIDDLATRGSNVALDWFTAVRSRFLDGFHVPSWPRFDK